MAHAATTAASIGARTIPSAVIAMNRMMHETHERTVLLVCSRLRRFQRRIQKVVSVPWYRKRSICFLRNCGTVGTMVAAKVSRHQNLVVLDIFGSGGQWLDPVKFFTAVLQGVPCKIYALELLVLWQVLLR